MPRLGYIREVPTVLGWRYHHGSITPRRTYVAKSIWQACGGCGKERWVRLVYRKPVSTCCRKCVYKHNAYTKGLTWGDAIEYLSSSPEEQQRALQEHYKGIKQANKQRRIDASLKPINENVKKAFKHTRKYIREHQVPLDKPVDKRFGKRTSGQTSKRNSIWAKSKASKQAKIDYQTWVKLSTKSSKQSSTKSITMTGNQRLAEFSTIKRTNRYPICVLSKASKDKLSRQAYLLKEFNVGLSIQRAVQASLTKSPTKSQGWFSRLFSRLYGLCKR
ncbi:hypothetical protein LCGC14_1627430 [marine sediment metagenome]|uniref:Uncharacterized protein n=1 Tax=marine sediment metagenome TaxID=412755 RepID=A0A0F9I3N1_9ZZZZ